MYEYSPLGEILKQKSNNGSCRLTRNIQHKMNDLFHGFEFIRVYIDDLVVLTKVYWTFHVLKSEITLNILE